MKSITAFSFFLLLAFNLAAQEVEKSKRVVIPTTDTLSRVCEKPRSPLYSATSDFDHLHVELITDFKTLNAELNEDTYPAVIQVHREAKPAEYYPVILSQRGKLRRFGCEVRPLRMQFLKSELKQKIEQALGAKQISPGSAAYMKAYYDTVMVENPKTDSVSALKEGIFKNLGDDVKFVTHCGKSVFDESGTTRADQQDQKVFSEYTLYKILETLQVPVEATRFTGIVYYNKDGSPAFYDKAGVPLEKVGFFREPPRSTAERCGLLAKLEDGKFVHTPDVASGFQVTFLHQFILNFDFGASGHNVNIFYDEQNREVYGPYDFDLSMLTTESNLHQSNFPENQLNALMTFVSQADQTIAKATLQRVVTGKSAMQDVVTNSEMDDAAKARFHKWLDMYVGSFGTYLQKNN